MDLLFLSIEILEPGMSKYVNSSDIEKFRIMLTMVKLLHPRLPFRFLFGSR